MNKTVIGVLAHVDAGKTTLSEAILYQTGKVRKMGRVDHGNTLLDTHTLERERGITIFASQAEFSLGEWEATLLDTPGHVDFSAETERMLQVLDYAILVISGTDGVQAHTRTLWRLLSMYRIPAFLFVTKMDFSRRSPESLMEELQRELGESCVDFRESTREKRMEALATCREDVLETYLATGEVSAADTASLIRQRCVFPCYFGSGLKLDGVEEFLSGLRQYMTPGIYPDAFGARVFKISYDGQGNRLTHMKITGGTLHVRDTVCVGENSEKIPQIRIYNGEKYTTVEEISAGGVCVIPGLSHTENGLGLGYEGRAVPPVLEPVMNYRIVLPEGCDARLMLPRFRQLEEEDPLLRITWNSHLQEIHVELMGTVQAEILRSVIQERFHVAVQLDSGCILYKETIENTVEGIGHYEPLRHYAEVHLLLEPLPRGSGLVVTSRCSEETLDRVWQKQVLHSLTERTQIGVRTGSPLTDMKITLASGRAHPKHTDGGDFRQAASRAVRQGLMGAVTVLLEPYYAFRLEVPSEQIGRAISDIRMRYGTTDAPEDAGRMMLLRGRAPVACMNDYAMEVAAYTGGQGRLFCEMAGYDLCHNPEEVTAAFGYQPERDLDNPADSIFCAHGGGFGVRWDQVPQYMHLESCLTQKEEDAPRLYRRNFHLDEKELEELMEREFGPIRRPSLRAPRAPSERTVVHNIPQPSGKKYVIVDGYNVIFAWAELKALADTDLEAARIRLLDILVNYHAYTRQEVVVVFDAYRVTGNQARRYEYHGIHVAFTRENEIGDVYIEKLVHSIGKNDHVRVVTSDGLIQISALRAGVLRVSAREFEEETATVYGQIRNMLEEMRKTPGSRIGDAQENRLSLQDPE